jgi:hypothetical protein
MVHELCLEGAFFSLIAGFDAKIAEAVAATGCRWCGGPLHKSNYLRKPRGAAFASAGEAFRLRHSLCCGRRGCRRRTLPPSLRFLGRRVYLGAVVLIASVVVLFGSATTAARETAVPRRTLRRWAAWWTETFPTLPIWLETKARFVPPPPDAATLPLSLFERLALEIASGATLADVALAAARLLAPATTSSVSDGSRFMRGIVPLSLPP